MDTATTPEGNLKACARCRQEFEPRRSNQKYCSTKCRKAGSKNTQRGSRKAENKERSWRHYARAYDLEEMVYSVAPSERLGVVRHILSYVSVDAGLRNILSDPKLLREPPRKSCRFNIAQVANRYTQKFFDISIKTYVRRALSGDAITEVEVKHGPVDFGSVPHIKTKLTSGNVKCWHRPLSAKPQAEAKRQLEADMARISEIVANAQTKIARKMAA